MVEISTLTLIVGIVTWLAGQLVVGAAIWGAIRSDMKHMHSDLNLQREDAKESRQQINKLFELYYQRNNSP